MVILAGNETGQALCQSSHATAGDLLRLRHEGEGTSPERCDAQAPGMLILIALDKMRVDEKG